MRKVREIYEKMRQVKYHHLVKLYKTFLKRKPENCRYNYPYSLKKDKIETVIYLCLLHQPKSNLPDGRFLWPPPDPDNAKIQPHLVDICHEIHHCSHCNAFVFRHSKKSLKDLFEEKLKDKKFKEKEYPDICALEWVLEKSVTEIPLIGWVWKFFYNINLKNHKK